MYSINIYNLGLNADCNDDSECFVHNSECNSNEDNRKTCQCRKGFVHFKDECLEEGLNFRYFYVYLFLQLIY